MLARIPTGENVHDFIEESSTGDSTCGFEKLSIPRQSFQTFSVRDDSPKRVDAQDLSGVDTVVAVFQSFCIDKSSIARDEKVKDSMKVDYSAESSVPRNDDRADTLNVNDTLESSPLRDEGKAMTKVDYNSCTKCPDIEYSSPRQRSSCKNKLDQENKNKRPARSCGKAASKKALLDLSSLQFTRRRRSSLCKQARATVWGLLGNTGPVLEQNGVVDISPKKTYRSGRLRGVQGNGKRENNKKVRNSAKFRGKRFIPTGPISLKVKFGKETACIMNVMTLIDDNKEEDCKAEKSFPELSKDVEYLLQKEAAGSKSFQSSDGNLEKASDMHCAITDSIENPDGNTSDDLWESPFQEEVDKVVVTIDNRISDSGTSPDSEVINLTPDAQINEKDPEVYSHDVSLTDEYLDSENASVSVLSKNANKGKRDNEHHQTGDCSVNGEVPSPENVINVPEFLTLGQTEKVGDVTCVTDTSTSITTENASLNTSNAEGFSKEPPPCPSAACLTISCEMSKFGSGVEANLSPRFGIELQSLESKSSEKLLPCTKGQKLAKNSRARKEIKSSLETSNSSRREKTSKKKGSEDKSPDKRKSKDKGDFNQIRHGVDNHPETGIHALSGVEEAGETGSGNKSLTGGTSQKIMVTVGVVEQYIPPRQAWVCCDDCEKWRRIPAVLADQINESRCSWVCKDNMDKNFADCSIPQEKSNAEINAELDISDASCEEDACDRLDSNKLRQKQLTVTQQAPWMRIKSNMFLHRRRKAQTIDEIMVCHCKPPSEGRVGCGDGCLNRMLNIECIQGTCPCGEFCSNQQFQKRKYAKLNSVKCGKKGLGLRLLEDVSEGQFLIEYVGEVLDMHAHEARQRDYAVKGHKHFYFMTLNGSEVIDACTKGNLGRFINHSCDPNCRTEKWMVNGEVCIGIFSLRDIKKGEEVTFDYNYVRVFGAAAKKCVCGSSQCRGYIGGDPLNAETIVQSDSDEEHPEPVMVRGNGEMNRHLNNAISVTSSLNGKEIKEPFKVEDHIDGSISINGEMDISSEKQTRKMSYQDKFSIDGSTTAAGCLKLTKGSGDSNLSASTAFNSVSLEKESWVGQHSPVGLVGTLSQSGDITSENMSAAPEECSTAEKCLHNPLCSNQGVDANFLYEMSDKIDSKKKLRVNVGEVGVVLSKAHARTKTSRTSSSVKKRKPKTEAVDIKKPLEINIKTHEPLFKPKRLLEDLSNGRYAAVQEKLNELLDSDGGISKRKDASRGYLKLLLLTAASGDSGNGEAIQSNRDLSMILDALLKTKSRTVLVDIINKNGLQMLHNIMKRYRKEFIKIPILRKLLKVLEFLARRDILTSEHINGGPRCPGVESFRDSILTLTEHTDKQVHQIARNFRDRWIPRCFRKFGCIERDDWRREFHQGSNHDISSASHTNSSDCAGIPSETPDCIAKPVVASNTVDAAVPGVSCESQKTRKRKSRWDQPSKESPDLGTETNMAGTGAHSMDEDVPPGFSFPLNHPMLPSDAYVNDIDHKKGRSGDAKCSYGVAMGYSQQRFVSRLSVAYGVPMSIVQQFGAYQAETSENWIVAPGMPFQPFPPLPPYPRDRSKHSAMSQAGEKEEQDSHNLATLDSSQNPPSTSRATTVSTESIGAISHPDFRQARGPHNLARKYFRQQKWNSSTAGAPWVQKRNGWGSMVNNSRNGMCQESLGSGRDESNRTYSSEDKSTSTQSGVTFHQRPWQQN